MKKYYDTYLSPLVKELDKILNSRKAVHIPVHYKPSRHAVVQIKRHDGTHVIFLEDEQLHSLLAFDYETGVLGEQAFDPGERPF